MPLAAVPIGALAVDAGSVEASTKVLPVGPACTAWCVALPATSCRHVKNQ
jgi:hypothetical protein